MSAFLSIYLSFFLSFFLSAIAEYHKFVTVTYGGTFKLNLLLNSSSARLTYSPDTSGSNDNHKWVILDRGELSLPPERNMEARFFLEDSVCILEQVTDSDAGLYQVTDLQNFSVSKFYLRVERKETRELNLSLNM